MGNEGDRRRLPRLGLLLLVAAPLALVALAAGVAFSAGGAKGSLPFAKGSSGGSFHPVASAFEPDDTELVGCRDDYRCLEQAFGNLAYREGPKLALTRFDERIASDRSVQADCHRIAHTIGSAAFARFGGNVAKTLSQGSATCSSGYYHGILDRAFVGITARAELATVARGLCAQPGVRRRGFLDYQCRHGLGHGLMIQSGYDLPLALSVCAGLGSGWDRVSCTGGVFMENVNTGYGFRSRWLNDDDPLDPCDRVGLRDRRSCYTRASTRVLELSGNDFATATRTCAGNGPRWARFCVRGLGRDAAAQARYDPDRILALCRLAGAAHGDCLYGAARGVADGFKGVGRATILCRRAPGAVRGECFAGLGVVVGLLYPTDEARRRACAGITRRHVQACAEAARDEVEPTGAAAWG